MRLSGPTDADLGGGRRRCATTRTGWRPRRRRDRPTSAPTRLGVGERAALMGTEGVLVEREAVEARLMPTANAPASSGPSAGMVERSLAGVHGNAVAGPAGAGRRPGAFGAGEQDHAGVTGGDAGRRGVEHADRRLAPGGVDTTAGGRDVECQPVGDQRGEIVVRPRADRHQVEHVGPGQQTTTRVGVGRPRRGGDERERLRRSRVVVVPVGDLTDPDDDRDGCRHARRSRGLHCAFAPRRDTRLAHAHDGGAAVEHHDGARHVGGVVRRDVGEGRRDLLGLGGADR